MIQQQEPVLTGVIQKCWHASQWIQTSRQTIHSNTDRRIPSSYFIMGIFLGDFVVDKIHSLFSDGDSTNVNSKGNEKRLIFFEVQEAISICWESEIEDGICRLTLPPPLQHNKSATVEVFRRMPWILGWNGEVGRTATWHQVPLTVK